MMPNLWQNIVIFLCLGGAVAYLVLQAINWRKHRHSCLDCRLMRTASQPHRRPKSDLSSN